MRFVPQSFHGRFRAGVLLLPTVGLCALTPAYSQQSAAPVARPAIATKQGPMAPAVGAGIYRKFARMPAAFERNRGQVDPRVQFLVHQPHSTLFLTPTEAVFALDAPQKGRVSSARTPQAGPASVLRMQLVGANEKAEAVGEKALSSSVNYFIGKDPSRWQEGVPTFAEARYKGVYHGVDVVYYGNQQHLEYDFVLAPHARPDQIALRFGGAEKVRIDSAGNLKINLPGQTLTWQRPTVYQQSRTGRQKVACRYLLSRSVQGTPVVRFALGRYDTARSLVIDPALIYSTFLGGSIGDSGNSIAVDSSGSAYITGYTSSTDFPTTTGAYQRTKRSTRRSNAFVTKLSADGTTLLYSTYLGGSGYESGSSIAIDSAGNAYVTGETDSSDFPTTVGVYQVQNLSGATAFVTKLNANGTALLYSTYLGGTSGEAGNGIAVDSSGSAYITGYTSSTNFPTTTGAYQRTNHSTSGTNAFVTKLSADGTTLLYSTYLGGSGYEVGNGIAVDSSGSAYITGYTGSTDFPTTSGAFQNTNRSSQRTNAFVTKLNATGTGLSYSTYLGGSSYGAGSGIAVDASGNAYVTGYTGSTDFPTTSGAYQTTNKSLSGSSAFVTKLNPGGTSLVCSTFLGGTGYEAGSSIAIDSAGNTFLTGYTASTDFPTTAGANQTTKRSISASLYGFFTKLNPTYATVLYSTYLGGSSGDKGNGIAIGQSGNAYITGSTGSTDFPVTTGVVQGTNKGGSGGNGFVTKLNPNITIPRSALDFNGDGKSDILMQYSATGQITAWYMNAFNRIGGTDFSLNPGVNYTLIGKGDFTGAGIATLVLQSQIDNSIVYWYAQGVNNATITGGDNVSPTPQSGWKVVGIGDFNGDGKSDLVFQSQTTNQVAIWFMNGPYYQSGVLMPYTPPSGWQVVGVGDFNGDGSPDLAFQNQSTGQIVIWFMTGSAYSSGTQVATTVASDWKVVGVADYNGDGMADLILQNQTSNQASVWFMNGATYLGGSILSAKPYAGWHIVGPR